MAPDPHGLVLLTGATGYVGRRLLKELEARGRRVRCLARRPAKLAGVVGPGTQVARGDVLDVDSLLAAMQGVDTACYMVHSMAGAGDFEQTDRQAAQTFARAAAESGVRRIVYLGGLASGPELSSHLASRLEVGRILRAGGVQTIELQASIILGVGSLSFEMIRALVEKLPVMVTPKWVKTRAQPIAVDDVVAYLAAALDLEVEGDAVFQIGGADVVSYRELMREYGRQRGLRRLMIPVPVLTPRLSSLWLGLVTPLQARVGRKLIEGVRNETVVRDDRARRAFAIRPRTVAEAIRDALDEEDRQFASGRWRRRLQRHTRRVGWGGLKFGTRWVDSRVAHVHAAPAHAFAAIRRIGGRTGWYYADWLWQFRGGIDRVLGGPGMGRGRTDPDRLAEGDMLDCWRVDAIEPDRYLRLRADMRLPGRAWLEFEVEPTADGSEIRQTAVFDAKGLGGQVYWHLAYPLHVHIFAGMLAGIVTAAEREGR